MLAVECILETKPYNGHIVHSSHCKQLWAIELRVPIPCPNPSTEVGDSSILENEAAPYSILTWFLTCTAAMCFVLYISGGTPCLEEQGSSPEG